jgi:hypothetical protein
MDHRSMSEYDVGIALQRFIVLPAERVSSFYGREKSSHPRQQIVCRAGW